jgi:hypothetical protein
MVATVHDLPVREAGSRPSPDVCGELIPFPLGLVRLPSESRLDWILARQRWLAARARQAENDHG